MLGAFRPVVWKTILVYNLLMHRMAKKITIASFLALFGAAILGSVAFAQTLTGISPLSGARGKTITVTASFSGPVAVTSCTVTVDGGGDGVSAGPTCTIQS